MNPRWTRAIWLLLAAMPGVVALGAIQDVRYGSPLGSGYGSFDDLFALSNVAPNLARYPRWMTETHTPFIWLWLLAPLSFRMLDRGARAFGWILYGFAVAVVLAYLPYVYFRPDEWSYTRFLLPALPLMTVLAALVLLSAARRIVPRAPVATAAVVCAIVGGAVAPQRGVARRVRHARRRAEISARRRVRPRAAARDRLRPGGAAQRQHHVLLGTADAALGPARRASLDRAIASLRRAGYEPFVVLDGGEDEQFRARFGARNQQARRRADADRDARQHDRLRFQMSARRRRMRIVRSSVNRDACA